MKLKLFLIALCLSPSISFAQHYISSAKLTLDGRTFPYQIVYPDNYNNTKQYPLIVYLHGEDMRGEENTMQFMDGGALLVEKTHSESPTVNKYPAIILVPQCPVSSYWSNVRIDSMTNYMPNMDKLTDAETKIAMAKAALDDPTIYSFDSTEPTIAMKMLMGLISDWKSSGRIDNKKIYLGGFSMGAMGVYELLWRMPNTFAAAFAIGGIGDTTKTALYAKNTSVWIFHGEADNLIPIKYSKAMYSSLQAEACDVKLSTYPNIQHDDTWSKALEEPQLLPWLFKHSK